MEIVPCSNVLLADAKRKRTRNDDGGFFEQDFTIMDDDPCQKFGSCPVDIDESTLSLRSDPVPPAIGVERTKSQHLIASQTETRYDEIIIPLLARRSFHLPGNNWKEDWIQWMGNNHVVFGTCFHHKLHPIEMWERYVLLVGSVSFALIATNVAYLWDKFDDGKTTDFDPTAVLFNFTIGGGHDDGGRGGGNGGGW